MHIVHKSRSLQKYHEIKASFFTKTWFNAKQESVWLGIVESVIGPIVYLTSPHVTTSPRPSPLYLLLQSLEVGTAGSEGILSETSIWNAGTAS